jgi:hypothetical protein
MQQFFTDYKDTFTIIGAVIASAIFIVGLFQFWRSERWKKNEFIAKSFRDMIDDPACQRAMSMLDWDGREINFWSHDRVQSQYCNYKLVVSALRTDDLNFPEVEMNIRDTFDRFFSFISLFESALKNRLIDKKSVHAYFSYWIQLLRGERHLPANLVTQIAVYIENYGFADVRKFLDRKWPAEKSLARKDASETVKAHEIHQKQSRRT